MDWNNKVKLVQLGNRIKNTEEDRKIFYLFVIEHVNDFDDQAWDMFANQINISVPQMEHDKWFWKQIIDKILLVNPEQSSHFTTRGAIRILSLQALLQEQL